MLFLNDHESTNLYNVLVYGKSGTGKSTLGVTAPKPAIFLSELQGWDAIKDAARRLGKPTPPTFFIQSKDDLVVALRALALDEETPLRAVLRALAKSAAERDGGDVDAALERADAAAAKLPYQKPETVVLDSMTDFFRLVADGIDRESPPKLGKDGLPTKAERYWQVLRDRCERLIRQFRDLHYHVVYLALLDDREVGEGDQRSRQVGPDCPMRALPSSLVSSVNLAGISIVQSRPVMGDDGKPGYVMHRWVRFAGPDWMMLKPRRPLSDVEVPNISDWFARLDSGEVSEPLDLGQGTEAAEEPSYEPPKPKEAKQAPAPTSEAAPAAKPEPKEEKPRRMSARELASNFSRDISEADTAAVLDSVVSSYMSDLHRCANGAPRAFESIAQSLLDRANEIGSEPTTASDVVILHGLTVKFQQLMQRPENAG